MSDRTEDGAPPAKRIKVNESAEGGQAIPALLDQLPKYVQLANEAEITQMKEKHGMNTEVSVESPQEAGEGGTQPQHVDLSAPSHPSSSISATPKPFLKRKVAMVVGYLGYKYQGLQRNPGAITIEALLEAALCKVGAIAAVNAHQWESGLDWMRAARTDKGVSAFYNIISLNMLLVPDFAEKMNQVLPEDIRIFGIYQVPRSFSAKDRCGARVYEYRLPTYLFKPSPQNTRFSAADWKFDATCKDYVDEILSAFLGTHRFHNFTVKMAYKEPQTERYIMSFKCSEPYEVGGIQWVTLTVRGQSFVLHQIRKMVAVAVSVVRDGQSADVIKALFCPPKQENITMAPSEGLCLASLDYERYNAKVATEKDSTSEVIAMTNETPTIEAFRDNIVVPHLAALEKEKTIFKNWLEGWQRFPLIYSKILSVLKKPTNRADGRVSQQPTADDGLKLSSVSAEPAPAAIDVQIGKSVTPVTEGPTSSPSTLADPTPVLDEPAE